VEAEALQARGLTEADLVVPVEVVSAQRMAEIMDGQDVILSF
jgi:tRNA 2-thiouridine synthesizing protein C